MDKAIPIPFDQYQRYGIAARAIEAIRKNGEPLNILEVGANTHKLLGRLLPNDRIVYLDQEVPLEMQGDGNIIVGDATELSLADASFDAVVALDVFEHIPNDRREAFLLHVCRIARLLTVIGAPFDYPFVVEAEREASDFWQSLFGYPHRWLAEHAENGLPNLDSTIQAVNSLGYQSHTLRHGDIKLWLAFIKGHFAKEYVNSLSPIVSIFDQYYEDHLFEHDFFPNESYRQFVFCSRESSNVQEVKDCFNQRGGGSEANGELVEQLVKFLPPIAIEKSCLNQVIITRDSEIAAILNSRSWRITKPLRYVDNQLRNIKSRLI